MTGDSDAAKVRCTVVLRFSSPEEAEKVHKSVELDNQGYMSTRVIGEAIHAEISSVSLNSLLHTLDDFMACATVAEKVMSRDR